MNTKSNSKFKTLTPSEGNVLTRYKEGDDIKSYTSATEVVAPLSLDETIYAEITKEQDLVYKDLQKKAFEEERENKNK